MISVFFDLDGVLADFVRGALAVHNRADFPIKDVPWCLEDALEIPTAEFWHPMGYEFWRNLEPLADGMKLLEIVERIVRPEQIGLFTSCCDENGCYDGKKAWVKNHLPKYARRMFTGSEKYMHAGPTKILIDDRMENCERWEGAGGLPILVPRPWNPHKYLTAADGSFTLSTMTANFLAELRNARSVEP